MNRYKNKRIKAVALLSEGLDSSLAVKLVQEQGIEVVGVNFVTPFCLYDRNGGYVNTIIKTADRLNIALKIFNIGEEHLGIVKNPRYGYGKNLNPCIACRILMFKKAKEFMNEIDAAFIVTGEVLGQRPMSQKRYAMGIIEKESGLEGFIVRPLSGKLLPPSIPEEKGWIKRGNLFDILGRSRKKQFDLLKRFKISDYAWPAGGCLLTDPIFSLKIKDLISSDMLNIDNINLIKNGRYFKIGRFFKLVVGRNKEENVRLISLARKGDLILKTESKGPVAIGRGEVKDEYIQIGLKIVAYYCKSKSCNFKIKFRVFPETEEHTAITGKISEEELAAYKVELKR